MPALTPDHLEDLTTRELQSLCSAHGKTTTGSKGHMTARLAKVDADSDALASSLTGEALKCVLRRVGGSVSNPRAAKATLASKIVTELTKQAKKAASSSSGSSSGKNGAGSSAAAKPEPKLQFEPENINAHFREKWTNYPAQKPEQVWTLYDDARRYATAQDLQKLSSLTAKIQKARTDLKGARDQVGRVMDEVHSPEKQVWKKNQNGEKTREYTRFEGAFVLSGENPYQRVKFMFKSLMNNWGDSDYVGFERAYSTEKWFQAWWGKISIKGRKDSDLVWERYLVLVDTDCIAPIAAFLKARVIEHNSLIRTIKTRVPRPATTSTTPTSAPVAVSAGASSSASTSQDGAAASSSSAIAVASSAAASSAPTVSSAKVVPASAVISSMGATALPATSTDAATSSTTGGAPVVPDAPSMPSASVKVVEAAPSSTPAPSVVEVPSSTPATSSVSLKRRAGDSEAETVALPAKVARTQE